MITPAARLRGARLVERPGLRTFASARFRILLAGTLLLIGLAAGGSLLMRQAADPAGQFGVDLADYQRAAQRMAAGGSPYAPEMLAGPVDAQGVDRYRYPPVLAQLLIPVAGLPMPIAAALWGAAQLAAAWLAVWVAGSAGWAARGIERALWTGVAATFFLPVFDSVWKGNVSTFVALAVAIVAVPRAAPGALAAVGGTLLKVAPGMLLPVALLAGGRRAWLTTAIAAAVVVGLSVAAAPYAWADYAIVLPNLLAGAADVGTNLAPSAVVAGLGAPDPAAGVVRILVLGVAMAAVVVAAVVAGRPAGRHRGVVLAAAAMLLIPAALWYHYLVALLPLAALAWARASAAERVTMVAGAAVVSAALAWLPLALAGSALMIVPAWRAMGGTRPAPTAAAARPLAS